VAAAEKIFDREQVVADCGPDDDSRPQGHRGVGIITFGAWVVTASIVKGWPLVWTLMALFPFLTGFISLYGSMNGTED
jgi:hypothetical protein